MTDLVFCNKDLVQKILCFSEDPRKLRECNKTFYNVWKNPSTINIYINQNKDDRIEDMFIKYHKYRFGELLKCDWNSFPSLYCFRGHKWNPIHKEDILLDKIKKMVANKDDIPEYILKKVKDRLEQKKLDENENLWLFSNGVYDITNKRFRDGLPSDYLSQELKIIDTYNKMVLKSSTDALKPEYIPFTSQECEIVLEELLDVFCSKEDVDNFISFMKKAAVAEKTSILLFGNGSKLATRILTHIFGNYHQKMERKPGVKGAWYTKNKDLYMRRLAIADFVPYQTPPFALCMIYNDKLFGFTYKLPGAQNIHTERRKDSIEYKDKMERWIPCLRYIILDY